jgi:predicted DNA binding CopG/RHH family protein
MKKINLEKDEQALLDSFERGEWKPVKDQRGELAKHRQYAANTLRKDRRVNIRISTKDLEEIQTRAAEDGVPYQTLMASVLHRYVSGTLVQSITRPPRTVKRKLNGKM